MRLLRTFFLAAEMAAAKTTRVAAFQRKHPARKPFPEHLPRERVVIPAPCSCPHCGGTRLSKLGRTSPTLDVIPRQWKVLQTVREVFVPGLREDNAAACALPHGAARLGWAELPRHAAIREIWAASASQSPGRTLCPGGRTSEPVDARRPSRRGHSSAHASLQADRDPCARSRATTRRRCHRARHGQGQD
jgi:hypothetical protein